MQEREKEIAWVCAVERVKKKMGVGAAVSPSISVRESY